LIEVIVLASPLVVLIVFSFNNSETIIPPFQGFTLGWFRALFSNPDSVAAIKTSFVVAGVVTPACVLLGLTSAYGIARLRGRGRGLALAFFSIPLVVPWLVTGVAGLLFFNSVNVQGSTWTVVIMQVVVTFPLVTLILYARLLGMDLSVEEAALDLGSGNAGVLLRVVLPQLTTPIIVSAFFAFISSIGNFVVTFFVSGYSSTLPIWSYSELRHAENLPIVNAASTFMLGINFVIFLGLLLMSRRDSEGVAAWL
jgi:spermidine/putrescine transport system permease protein